MIFSTEKKRYKISLAICGLLIQREAGPQQQVLSENKKIISEQASTKKTLS